MWAIARLGGNVNREQKQNWEALLFVLAAGGVALAFVGVGWYLANKRREEESPRLAGLDALERWMMHAAPEPSALPPPPQRPVPAIVPKTSHPLEGSLGRIVVTNSPTQLVSSGGGGVYAKDVTITTDQPIRVDYYGGSVSATSGIYVAAGQPVTITVGPNQQLWAIRASGANANVGTHSQRKG